MERRYRKLVRKVKAYLKKERRNKTFWSRFISDKTFHPEYWTWHRENVATGWGWGAFFAIAPVPMQSLFGAAMCVWRKGNIPIAVLAAWLSPPGTLFFSVPLQWYFGSRLMEFTPWGSSGLGFDLMKNSISESLSLHSLEPLKAATSGIGFWKVISEFGLGAILSCSLLGLFCYFLTQTIWKIVQMFRKKDPPSDTPSPVSDSTGQ